MYFKLKFSTTFLFLSTLGILATFRAIYPVFLTSLTTIMWSSTIQISPVVNNLVLAFTTPKWVCWKA